MNTELTKGPGADTSIVEIEIDFPKLPGKAPGASIMLSYPHSVKQATSFW